MNSKIFLGAMVVIALQGITFFWATHLVSSQNLAHEEINLECAGSEVDGFPGLEVHIDKNRRFASRNSHDVCELLVFKSNYVLHCDQGSGATVIVSRRDLTAIDITLEAGQGVTQTEVQCTEVSQSLRI